MTTLCLGPERACYSSFFLTFAMHSGQIPWVKSASECSLMYASSRLQYPLSSRTFLHHAHIGIRPLRAFILDRAFCSSWSARFSSAVRSSTSSSRWWRCLLSSSSAFFRLVMSLTIWIRPRRRFPLHQCGVSRVSLCACRDTARRVRKPQARRSSGTGSWGIPREGTRFRGSTGSIWLRIS